MKTGIVGSGMVGATVAYALVMRGIGREIIMIDRNNARAEAEAADLMHAVPFAEPMQIRAGNYPDLAGSQVVIIAAGVSQRPGESRLALLERNAAIFKQVIPAVLAYAPEAILLIASNPVDPMTHLAARCASKLGVPSNRIIGSGTTLDTARFRSLLGNRFGIDPHHIHGYVIGEHGNSEVLTWSLVTIGGMPLKTYCDAHSLSFEKKERAEIDQRVRHAANSIIMGKGATYYGVGSALARVVDVILHDQRSIMTVCSPIPMIAGINDVTLSLPCLIGGSGILETFPLNLNRTEEDALAESARILHTAIEELEQNHNA